MFDRPPSTPPPGAHRLLVVDDDGHIREVLRYALVQAGHEVTLAKNGLEALESFQVGTFDLVVLDILMPGLDGLEVCRQIRKTSSIPLIFVSSRDEELDRILGLEMGADDYIVKPFSPRELVARVKATLRRADEIKSLQARTTSGPGESPAPPPGQRALKFGPLVIDRLRHECRVEDQLIVLTVSEFSLLAALLERPTQVQSRGQLVERAYGPSHFLSDRTVDSHIRRIRGKLKAAGYECIETVYGVGYRLTEAS
jgi:two-component system OmpR family response regulator